MMDWMNINEISKVIDTPAPTVRRYIQKHQAFLNTKKQGKKILLHPDSIELLKKIRKWYVVDNMIDIEIDNKLMVEEIKEIKQSYKEGESKREQRDLALMEIVRSMQETKKSIAASEEKKKWWEFWK